MPSGVFYLALKSGSGDARDDLGRLYAYYTLAELEDITRTYGLHVIRIFTGRSAGMSGKPENWVGLLCRKQSKLNIPPYGAGGLLACIRHSFLAILGPACDPFA